MTGPLRPVRAVLCDVDGTLVTRDKRLTPRAVNAVKALQAAGVGFTVTSARPPRGLAMLIEPLGLTEPVAGFNGGVLTTPGLAVIETHPIDPAAARRATEIFLGCGADVWVYDADAWHVRDAGAAHVAREAWILQFGPVTAPSFSAAILDQAIKIVAVSDDHGVMEACENAVRAALGDTVSATRSADYFVDVTHPRATKGEVVHTLARLLGLDPQEIATIGDMPNDVLMFQESGFSVAMGNASDAVKARASAVTDDNENDGFAKAVERFLLPALASPTGAAP